MKEGSVIFLTKRKIKNLFDYRGIISFCIAVMTRKRKQRFKEVKTHAAIIYKYNDELHVRDMDRSGTKYYTLQDYESIFGDRMEIIINPFLVSSHRVEEFNKSCAGCKVSYDYKNTFYYQIIKSIFHIFVGKNTFNRRMCSEDVMRQFNLLLYTFNSPEEINPNELYFKINKWNK